LFRKTTAPPSCIAAAHPDQLPPFRNPNGIGWFIVAVFLVDDVAGGGIVAIPTAMVQTEFYLGFLMFLVMLCVTMYTAYVLGLSWNILLNTYPEYRTFTDTELSYCYVVLIVAVCLLPVTFLKSPQDFWWAVVVAMATSAAGIVLIFVGTALDYGLCSKYTGVPPLRAKNFFLALGTLIFSCGGHAAFPTIQHDMRDPSEYHKSVFTGFAMLLFIYGPIAVLGFFTYHDAIRDSILPSIQVEIIMKHTATLWIQQTCNVLITIHCILTLIIVINPLNQDLEELFHCPQRFCWQRVAVRTGCMLTVVFIGESIPNFGPLLDLVGGSAQTLSSIILPALFYLFLVTGRIKEEKMGGGHTSTIVGIIGGGAATFSAIMEISTASFLAPCYVDAFKHQSPVYVVFSVSRHQNSRIFQKHPSDNGASVYCCGPFQNVTHTGRTDLCVPMPSSPFYG
uniref:Aa_trans domain-containing protein n=1 Tax=Nippostrongylus brasiliensis TaxID=27835 RepID=A0A0N4YAV5_NIPBR